MPQLADSETYEVPRNGQYVVVAKSAGAGTLTVNVNIGGLGDVEYTELSANNSDEHNLVYLPGGAEVTFNITGDVTAGIWSVEAH